MVQQNLSGLAVVDSAGVLVDTISVRDLRGIGVKAENWQAMWLTVKGTLTRTSTLHLHSVAIMAARSLRCAPTLCRALLLCVFRFQVQVPLSVCGTDAGEAGVRHCAGLAL